MDEQPNTMAAKAGAAVGQTAAKPARAPRWP